MKGKKAAALLLTGAMAFSLVSCGNAGKRGRDEDETGRTTAEETAAKTYEKSSGSIIDFEDMHFFVNGKKYTLGRTTLQEMFDDGVPFLESDRSRLGQKLKGESGLLTGAFSIELDENLAAQVYIMNISSEEKPYSECVINRIILSNIDGKHKNKANLSFDFPLNMTMSELEKLAGEPSGGVKHVGDTDIYAYGQKSKKYHATMSYNFQFENDVLRRIEIEYAP